MQSHLGSVVLCLISTYAWLGSKFFGTFTRIVVKVYNLCRVKTNRLAVLTVKSGLDPHMINKFKDGIKSLSGYFLWPCWVPTISVLTLGYCCSEVKMYEVCWRCCWVLGVRNPQSIACEVEAIISRISCITLIVFYLFFFSLLRDTVADYSLIMSLYVWNLILAYI